MDNQTSTRTDPPAHDSIGVRQLLRLALRTLPYLRGIRRDVGRLLLVALALLPFVVVLGWLAYDLYMNRMLAGDPVTAFEAKLLWLDPARYVEVEKLSVASREVLRGRLVITTLLLAAVIIPIGLRITFWVIGIIQRVNQTLRTQMIGQVQAMSVRYHSGERVGDSIFRTYQDSATMTNLMAMLVRPIPRLFGLVLALVISFPFAPWLIVVLLLGYGAEYLLASRMTPALRRDFRLARERNSALTSRIQETMAGVKLIKAYGSEAVEQKRFERDSRAAFEAAFHARSRYALVTILGFTIAALTLMVPAAVLAIKAANGEATWAASGFAFTGFAVWNLGAYSSVMGRLTSGTNNARMLVAYWSIAQDMAIGMQRAFSQVDLEPEVSNAPDAQPLPEFKDAVSFHDVRFGYQPEHPVLHDVDLTARAGTITALVGPTGSGKSTLVSLLLRLFDPDEGRIQIDGTDIRAFDIDSLRNHIAIALQENLLFGTTIRENIRYAVPDAGDEQVREAARIACADEFIDKLPQGYDTPLGERGSKLSTGQRQRLSIARAIIKDTPILVLDEPTASLDADTELRVLRNLSEWGRGRAIFLITHRLSTIRRADQIIYLSDGTVVESGSHDELMRRTDGAYRRFVELEASSTPSPVAARAIP